MRLSLIQLRSLRMNEEYVGINGVEVLFIPHLNALAPPTRALFDFIDYNLSLHLKCEIECKINNCKNQI